MLLELELPLLLELLLFMRLVMQMRLVRLLRLVTRNKEYLHSNLTSDTNYILRRKISLIPLYSLCGMIPT